MMSLLRQVELKDYAPIIQVIDNCWRGRSMAGMLHGSFLSIFSPPAL